MTRRVRQFTTDDIKKLLIEDLESKKSFEASWDTECSLCYDMIFRGDTFYFIGEKKKICVNCFGEIQSVVEEI